MSQKYLIRIAELERLLYVPKKRSKKMNGK